jgi:hypothetical protein
MQHNRFVRWTLLAAASFGLTTTACGTTSNLRPIDGGDVAERIGRHTLNQVDLFTSGKTIQEGFDRAMDYCRAHRAEIDAIFADLKHAVEDGDVATLNRVDAATGATDEHLRKKLGDRAAWKDDPLFTQMMDYCNEPSKPDGGVDARGSLHEQIRAAAR